MSNKMMMDLILVYHSFFMLFIYIVLTFHLNSGIFFVDDVVVIVDLVGVHILQSTIHKTNSMVKLEYDNFNKKIVS